MTKKSFFSNKAFKLSLITNLNETFETHRGNHRGKKVFFLLLNYLGEFSRGEKNDLLGELFHLLYLTLPFQEQCLLKLVKF